MQLIDTAIEVPIWPFVLGLGLLGIWGVYRLLTLPPLVPPIGDRLAAMRRLLEDDRDAD